jgi:hypothetical protein
MRIYKSIAGAPDILMTWTANYMLVWQQNNEEMMTELQISLLTDFIQHCTQNNKAMWTNKHVENPNTNRFTRTLCINSRGWCLERLPLLENLQSLHCLMCKFGNSSPHSYLKNNVTYRGQKQKVLSIKIWFFFSVLFEIICLKQCQGDILPPATLLENSVISFFHRSLRSLCCAFLVSLAQNDHRHCP